ncbi:MAG: adenylate/guanylate cyclase domain-containing protein [Candidatus Promineifilaceae bacterium]
MGSIVQREDPNVPTGTVSFLFTDIVESTRHWEEHPETMRVALARHDELLTDAADAQNGYIFKNVGDALCISFQTVAEALETAVAGQRALATMEQPEVESLQVRMAIHCGECYERGGDYFGPTVNRVARLQAVAYGGQIVISQAAYELLQDRLPADIQFRDLGLHKLRDLSRQEHVYQVLSPDLPTEFPSLRSLDYFPNNLPAQMTAFIGRRKELREVQKSLESTRLLTLTGPGGTGKTRLALQVAAETLEDYDDGVYFIPLEAVSDPNLVGQTIVSALGVDIDRNQDPLDALKDHLRPQRTMLLIDNFEHLLEAARITGELLSAAPMLKIMVTSREPLHVYGEREFLVSGLETPARDMQHSPESLLQSEAISLFVDRIKAVKHDFMASPEIASDLAAICDQLDGLPLAIELAAARVKMFSIPVLLERLQGSLGLLGSGPRDAPSRHKTLHQAIGWSYNLLNDDEAKLFRRWSIFRGGATLDAAESVCLDQGDLPIYDLVSSLLDKSLLLVANEDGGEPRFTMSSTIRYFAREHLAQSDELESARRRHLTYFLSLSQEASAQLSSGEYTTHRIQLLSDNLDNLRAALTWSLDSNDAKQKDREAGVLLAGYLYYFWYQRGLLSEGRRWLGLALDESQAYSSGRGTIVSGLGLLAWQQGDYEPASAYLQEAIAIFRNLGDNVRLAVSLHWHGHLTFDQQSYLLARELFAESLSMYKELGKVNEQVILNKDVGLVAYHEGDYLAARMRFEECLAHYMEQGNIEAAADVHLPLGDLARMAGDLEMANSHYIKSQTLFQETEIKLGLASCNHKLGQVALKRGEFAKTGSLLRKSLAIQREVGNKQGVAECLAAFASLVCALGELELAVQVFGGTDDFLKALGAPLAPADRMEMDRDIEVLRRQLGEEQFNLHWEQGRKLPTEALTEMASEHLCKQRYQHSTE